MKREEPAVRVRRLDVVMRLSPTLLLLPLVAGCDPSLSGRLTVECLDGGGEVPVLRAEGEAHAWEDGVLRVTIEPPALQVGADCGAWEEDPSGEAHAVLCWQDLPHEPTRFEVLWSAAATDEYEIALRVDGGGDGFGRTEKVSLACAP